VNEAVLPPRGEDSPPLGITESGPQGAPGHGSTPLQRTVTAIVVTYKTGDVLRECLDALLSTAGLSQILVVNNGNQPEELRTIEAAQKRSEHFEVRHTGENKGFGYAANLGASAANSEFLLFVNPDAVIDPNCVQQFTNAAHSRSGDYLIGGKLRTLDGHEQRGARRLSLTPWRAFVSFTGLAKLERWFPVFQNVHREKDPAPPGLVPMPVISGALFFVPRASFERIGRFDERYFLHVEDIDLCRTMTACGGQVYYLPTASALHYGSTSRVSGFVVDLHKAFGLARYFAKWNARPFTQVIGWVSFLPIAILLIVRRLAILTRQTASDVGRLASKRSSGK
jgi:GT2 family glycosyltransferase